MRMHEWLRWLTPAAPRAEARRVDLEEVDERLNDLERIQADIKVRLRLLERQADPRGIRRADGG